MDPNSYHRPLAPPPDEAPPPAEEPPQEEPWSLSSWCSSRGRWMVVIA